MELKKILVGDAIYGDNEHSIEEPGYLMNIIEKMEDSKEIN